jgi:phosphoribosylformylglycinamidine synthase subunit PurS
MKVRVHVSLKPSVLDPQGQAILHALHSLGHSGITGVRQGKYFDIEADSSLDRAALEAKMLQIGEDVLSNPVIEDFHLEFLET